MMKLFSLCFFVFACFTLQAQTFSNPLLPDGADPWITQQDGWFYYTHTTGRDLKIWKVKSPADLQKTAPKTVWTPPDTGANSTQIWAPELHFLQGKWYLYYTATDKKKPGDDTRFVFALENGSADPTKGKWTDRGKISTQYSGLDGSVFTLNNTLYFLYSAYVGKESVLQIVKMKDPVMPEGKETTIARPNLEWERFDDRAICEGPEFIRKDEKSPLCIVYSASACWDDNYCLGMLTAAAGADPLDEKSWVKQAEPVFKKSEANGVWGPGHNGFFRAKNGEDWILYHAKSVANHECSGRNPRMQPFIWSKEGLPVFGEPVKAAAAIDLPK
ncbi:MAG: glycoside hydrolase family 43 protein [Mucilaginibacter polytrichastri]|nr:glycoside hydrolase family 43 protein [Mucilaginibacter polytrichastri]